MIIKDYSANNLPSIGEDVLYVNIGSLRKAGAAKVVGYAGPTSIEVEFSDGSMAVTFLNNIFDIKHTIVLKNWTKV